MHYAVLFTDDPERGAMRAQHMAAHLDFLARHADRIRAAGPLLDADGKPQGGQLHGGQPHGGLWLVEAESRAAVQALVEEDPFWPTGLRRSVAIHEWRRVFADGRRL